MDYLKLLNDNTSKILSNSKKIRDFLANIVDENSFVETDIFMSGKSYSDGSDALGEGVITGYATINDYPVCIVAQNSEVLGGSLGKAQADKILKCIYRAIKTTTPLLSIIDSNGARVGEGVQVLEGYGEIIAAATELKNHVTHFAVVKGNALGLMGMYAATADFIFMSEKSALAVLPPLVLAPNVNDQAQKFIGKDNYAASSLMSTFEFKTEKDISDKITNLIKYIDSTYVENNDDPNRISDILNGDINAAKLLAALSDDEKYIELYSGYAKDVITCLASINSIPVGIVATNGEKLNKFSIKKIKKFVKLLDVYSLPLITLVDSKGIDASLSEEQDGMILTSTKLIAEIAQADIAKLAVITGNAIGYSYVALASKSVGFDYVIAFSNAKLAPIASEAAVNVIYSKEFAAGSEPLDTREKLAEKYKTEEMNPFISAKDGYVDNIIEPALIRPYVSSALAMLTK